MLYFIGLGLLLLVFVPGLGREANGAALGRRRAALSRTDLEFVKIFIVLYMASYLVRRQLEVAHSVWGLRQADPAAGAGLCRADDAAGLPAPPPSIADDRFRHAFFCRCAAVLQFALVARAGDRALVGLVLDLALPAGADHRFPRSLAVRGRRLQIS